MRIEYLGHASVRVELDGIGFLTDPALEPRIGPLRSIGPLRRIVAPVPERALVGLGAVLISHLHLDHLDLASLRRIGPEVPVVVPDGAAAWLRAQGRSNVVELGPGDETRIAGIRVRAIHARHGGYRSPRGPRAVAVGYVIEASRRVYFAGDTGLFPGMGDLADVDVALLPVSGWGPTLPSGTHLDPVRAAHAAALIGARVVVPIHWGTYRPVGLHGALKGDVTGPPRALVRIAAEVAPESTISPIDIGDSLDVA